MKVAVIGPGALGCLLAALLTRKKRAEIWLLDKNPRRVKKIKDSGIKVTGLSGDFTVKVNITADAAEIGKCDLAIMCVKSYDTESATKAIEPLLNENSEVLTLQNGFGNLEMISEIIGKDQVIGGVTSQAATLLSEGCVAHQGKGETIIGKPGGKHSVAMRYIRELFDGCGFPVKLTKDINAVIWSKLIINTGINALTALTLLPNGAIMEYPESREVMSQAVTEAVRVAKRKRVKLSYDDPIQKVESVCCATTGNVSSMLQDVLKKKKTEIDFINGAIVRLGKSFNLPTPVNLVLTDLVKTREASYAKQVSGT